MKKATQIMSVLLLIQLGIVFYVNRPQDSQDHKTQEKLLAGLDKDKLAKIVIEESDEDAIKTLTLEKHNGEWQLPEGHNFPVNPDKIRKMIEKLTSLQRGWPVGKTEVALRKFELSPDKFKRRLTFTQEGKEVATLYLGDSPSFKKRYASIAGEKLSYRIEYQLPGTKIADWQHKKLLHQEREKIKSITWQDHSLNNNGGDFELASVPEGKQSKKDETVKLARKLMNLGFTAVKGLKEEVKFGDKVLEIKVKSDKDAEIIYNFYQEAVEEKKEKAAAKKEGEEDDDKKVPDLLLTLSNQKFAFSVKPSTVSEFQEFKLDSYLEDIPEPEKTAENSEEEEATETSVAQQEDGATATQPPDQG